MVDGNSIMVQELSEQKNLNQLQSTIERIIKKSGVLRDKHSPIQFIPFSIGKPNCTIFFKIEVDNAAYGDEITIVIRPDNNTNHRVMRVIIQEGNKTVEKKEDKEGIFHKSDDDIFESEIVALEADIQKLLHDYVLRKEAEHKKSA
jgi:hypothetical protein